MTNKSNYEFTDISTEKLRTYDWGDGRKVIIKEPTHLAVSSSGHRVFSADGISHYIPFGWIHLFWEVKEGQPNFVK